MQKSCDVLIFIFSQQLKPKFGAPLEHLIKNGKIWRESDLLKLSLG